VSADFLVFRLNIRREVAREMRLDPLPFRVSINRDVQQRRHVGKTVRFVRRIDPKEV